MQPRASTSLLLLLCALIGVAFSAAPTSFCKCTCFTNSTIIALGPSSSVTTQAPPLSLNLRHDIQARAPASASCSQCNRAFCLSNHLPICKGAEEKDVFTTCFQRDSTKDQVIVLAFIGATVGLLAWAAVKKVIEKRRAMLAVGEELGRYASVGGR